MTDASYSIDIVRTDESKQPGDDDWRTPLASISVRGERAAARLLHGYAESLEDELPPFGEDTQPMRIVQPDWFEKALDSAAKRHEMAERARWVFQQHFSPESDAAAKYILTGDATGWNRIIAPRGP